MSLLNWSDDLRTNLRDASNLLVGTGPEWVFVLVVISNINVFIQMPIKGVDLGSSRALQGL